MKSHSSIESVDIFKFIGSIMIFAMHGNALGDNECASLIFECLARWAVPFFFILSSFFLSKKIHTTEDRKSTLIVFSKRIFSLYLVWFIINLPSVFYTRIMEKGVFKISTYVDFFKNGVLGSTFLGSWYLVSTIVCAWLCYYVFQKIGTVKKLVIASFFQTFCIFNSAYIGLLPESVKNISHDMFCFPLNIFGGLFYFVIGEAIYLEKFKISGHSTIFGICLFYPLYICEILFTKSIGIFGSTDYAFCSAPLALCVVIGVMKLKLNIKNSTVYRKLSTVIYCAQSNVFLILRIMRRIGIQSHIIAFAVCALCMGVICLIVLLLQKRLSAKWVKCLT